MLSDFNLVLLLRVLTVVVFLVYNCNLLVIMHDACCSCLYGIKGVNTLCCFVISTL